VGDSDLDVFFTRVAEISLRTLTALGIDPAAEATADRLVDVLAPSVRRVASAQPMLPRAAPPALVNSLDTSALPQNLQQICQSTRATLGHLMAIVTLQMRYSQLSHSMGISGESAGEAAQLFQVIGKHLMTACQQLPTLFSDTHEVLPKTAIALGIALLKREALTEKQQALAMQLIADTLFDEETNALLRCIEMQSHDMLKDMGTLYIYR